MKTLSIVVPCYNSAAYMRTCIDSLLTGGTDMQILIVDDGSDRDRTGEIADEYARNYPGICRAIHQENRGHGGAINAGLAAAEGMFFKVVDSDDWLEPEALRSILSVLNRMMRRQDCADVVFSNYIYDNRERKHTKTMQYRKYFPQHRMFGWKETRSLGLSTYVLMHALIYRTALLREEIGLHLPEHTYYEDNIYSFVPMARAQRLYYVDVDLYHYMLGRPDQSVSTEMMLRRVRQQYRINRLMIKAAEDMKSLTGRQAGFLTHQMALIFMVTTVLCLQTRHRDQPAKLWKLLQAANPGLYTMVAHSAMGRAARIPGPVGHGIILLGNYVGQKMIGFR